MPGLRSIALLLAIVPLAFPGCTQLREPDYHGMDRALAAREKPSVEQWENSVKNGRTVLKSTAARSAILFAGRRPDDFRVRSQKTTRGSVRLSVKIGGTEALNGGTAVPVSDDGYFLTAAHVVDTPPLVLVALTAGLQFEKRTARVVWSGGTAGPDLALIHAPLRPLAPYTPNALALPGAGDPVAVFGYSDPSDHGQRFSAGHVFAVSGMHQNSSGAAWRVIAHDVPILDGDSGGPLVTDKGALAGITSLNRIDWNILFLTSLGWTGNPSRPLTGYHAESIAPDSAWLTRIIAADRKSH